MAVEALDGEQAKKVLRQVEFYFSDSNLPRDNFLKNAVSESEDGLVSLSLICSFTRMRGHLGLGALKPEEIPENVALSVAETLRKSSFLKISEDGKKVGRSTELRKPEEVIEQIDSRTVAASPLPHDAKLEDVETFFKQYGKVNSVRLPRHAGDKRLFCGSALIEFSEDDDIEKIMTEKLIFEGVELQLQPKKDFDAEREKVRDHYESIRSKKTGGQANGGYPKGLIISFKLKPKDGSATIQILRGLRERFEIHHKLQYTDDAIVAAAQLAHQYISDRFLPDKAIDLIDEAGSRVRLRHAVMPEEAKELDQELRQITKEKNEAIRGQDFEKAGELRDREMELKTQISALIDKNKEKSTAALEAGAAGPLVTESDIQHIVSTWTGIPVEKVSSDESQRLLKMEETLHRRVIGQDEAVKAISRAIRRARVGLKNPNRPIASFIFSGPTGVGKSELAKSLAAYYFGSEEAMIRLDMSEFMERHTVSKLIGSPPGYVGYSEGGQLTEAVRRRPYTLVLFDEIEKAHPDVFNMMLQILEDGRLTDSKGRTVDFKNTLLIMTSNVGSSVIEKGGRRIGFDLDYDEKDSSYSRIKSLVTEELKQYFRPEFLNRLDEMIVFRQLTKIEVKEIADIMLKEVVDRLKNKEIELQVTERFRERVVEEGYNPSYGARPLRRAIMRLLEDSLAEKMLSGEIKEGDSAIIDVDDDGSVSVLGASVPDLSAAAPEAIPF